MGESYREIVLTKTGKVLLFAGVLIIMLLLSWFAGGRVGEDIGTFLYNLSH